MYQFSSLSLFLTAGLSPSFNSPNFFQKKKEVWGSGGAENDNWRKVFIGPGGDLSLLDL